MREVALKLYPDSIYPDVTRYVTELHEANLRGLTLNQYLISRNQPLNDEDQPAEGN